VVSREVGGYVVVVICRWIDREVAGPPHPGRPCSGGPSEYAT
jgi:hypothetical protein